MNIAVDKGTQLPTHNLTVRFEIYCSLLCQLLTSC